MGSCRLGVWDSDRLRVVLDVAEASPDIDVVGTPADGTEVLDLVTEERPDVLVLDESQLDDVHRVARQVTRTSPSTRLLVLHRSDDVPLALLEEVHTVVGRSLPPLRVVAEITSVLVAVTRSAAVPLPRDLSSARAARRFVERAALAWGAGGLQDTLALLATELVANAVRHGDGDIDITVRITADSVRVEVRDSSETAPAVGSLISDHEHGRGLALVDALASTWGVEPTLDGKSVWFEIDLRERGDAAAPGADTLPGADD